MDVPRFFRQIIFFHSYFSWKCAPDTGAITQRHSHFELSRVNGLPPSHILQLEYTKFLRDDGMIAKSRIKI
jgi:hypothetical protein